MGISQQKRGLKESTFCCIHTFSTTRSKSDKCHLFSCFWVSYNVLPYKVQDKKEDMKAKYKVQIQAMTDNPPKMSPSRKKKSSLNSACITTAACAGPCRWGPWRGVRNDQWQRDLQAGYGFSLQETLWVSAGLSAPEPSEDGQWPSNPSGICAMLHTQLEDWNTQFCSPQKPWWEGLRPLYSAGTQKKNWNSECWLPAITQPQFLKLGLKLRLLDSIFWCSLYYTECREVWALRDILSSPCHLLNSNLVVPTNF